MPYSPYSEIRFCLNQLFVTPLVDTLPHVKVLSTLLNEMDGIGARLGDSKGAKVAAEAEGDNMGAESDAAPDSEVKVGPESAFS